MKYNSYLKLYDSGNIKLAFNSQIGMEEKQSAKIHYRP